MLIALVDLVNTNAIELLLSRLLTRPSFEQIQRLTIFVPGAFLFLELANQLSELANQVSVPSQNVSLKILGRIIIKPNWPKKKNF